MNRTRIRESLQDVLEDELDYQFGNLSDDMTIAQFGLDSVDYVSLIMRWEDAFRIRLSNEELKSVTTIGSLLDLIEAKVVESVPTKAAREVA